MQKLFSLVFILTVIVAPFATMADQNSDLIASLWAQIKTLQAQVAAMSVSTGGMGTGVVAGDVIVGTTASLPPLPTRPPVETCPFLTYNLQRGSRDKATEGQVTMLQKFLVSRGVFSLQIT